MHFAATVTVFSYRYQIRLELLFTGWALLQCCGNKGYYMKPLLSLDTIATLSMHCILQQNSWGPQVDGKCALGGEKDLRLQTVGHVLHAASCETMKL